ncbi:MAG: helix-turn-helix domain-containing protein [Streptococcaceae bacterium]|jgi:transcriptional regulator with XRE-family HTH domain|nr:helix-turn-helix domain-containing protein [Streptococcaceae bacterium]
MAVFETIKDLAAKRGKNVKEVATELGFAESLVYQWKTSSPKTDTLQKFADYFGVSVDYLLGRQEIKTITEKDLDTAIDHAVFFEGKELNEADKAMYKDLLRTILKNRE